MCDGECDKCEFADCLYPMTLLEYIEIVEAWEDDD
jgi:hypothetical protein